MAGKWLQQLFAAGEVNKGNLVRRQKTDVEKYSSFDELKEEVERRGFHLIETGSQYVVICNTGQIQMHC